MNYARVGKLVGENARTASASGAAFYAFARRLVLEGWKICGAVWDADFKGAHHEIITSMDGLERLRGSKYVASRLEGILAQIKDLIGRGELVCFCGCPCQVAALLSFVGGSHQNLLTIELICSGVPEPILLQRCVEDIERRKRRKVTGLRMRKIDAGRPFRFQYRLEGEKDYRVESWMNRAYVRLWMSGYAKRSSCFACAFKGHPNADLTIGDAWGLQRKADCGDDGRGLSVVVVHTSAALRLVGETSDFISNEVAYEDVVAGNPALVMSKTLPEAFRSDRERLLNALKSDGKWKVIATQILELGFWATFRRYVVRMCT